GKRLVAVVIAVVCDGEDVAVIAIAQMEVVADGEDTLGCGRGRHEHRLQSLVVAEAVGDGAAADKAGERAGWSVGRAGDVVDAMAGIDGRDPNILSDRAELANFEKHLTAAEKGQ